jgi:hypothetical protein
MDFQQATRKVQALENKLSCANGSVELERAEVEQAKEVLIHVEEAQRITQHIASLLQQRAHERMSRVVSRCLEAVFEEPYEFLIRFERKRGKTEAVLEFTRDGEVYSDPLNEVGGGVLDVAALALRLSCVMVSKPPSRRTFILDEPWSNVRGASNRDRTSKLLKVLSEEFGVQWIINTDIPSYRAGTVVDMSDQ